MIMQFPRFSDRVRFLTIQSFLELLWVLHKKGAIFVTFWSRVAYQALILTCTGPEISVEQMMDVKSSEPMFKEYIYFWENLFKIPLRNPIEESDQQIFHSAIYDQIMKSLISIPQNLDLNTVDSEVSEIVKVRENDISEASIYVANTSHSSGDITRLQASNPKDFAIFVNFVEFCELFLHRAKTNDFLRWIYIFSQVQVALSTKYPLVSGFYRLCSTSLQICKGSGFVKGILKEDLYGLSHEGSEAELKPDIPSVQRNFFILFTKYLKEVLVRLRLFKDELLVSCLKLILNIPQELITINELLIPLKDALRLGQSFPPIAFVALDAIEVWIKDLPKALLKPHLANIFENFNDYLAVVGGTEGTLQSLVDERLKGLAGK
ncbi:hypothetical protein HK096_008869, partial [Nowakowskiella sp. JEL0078]